MKNSICICSFIKDEIEYLDEFLKYHIDLGIDHIFLFEDYNSLSHKEITDKYPGKVTLRSICSIISESNVLKLAEIRNHRHRQPEYLRSGLSYIQNNTDYEWCLGIDIDEYLTLRDSDLSATLNTFKDYEAVKIQWQNYNANGHILKPDYSQKNIQETYTRTCGFSRTDHVGYGINKLLFNLKTFNIQHIFNVHSVHSDCHALEKTDKLCLRHYITKSWEEYVWKLKVRGMFYIEHRDYNDFFDMNPELKDRENELLEIAKNILENHGEI